MDDELDVSTVSTVSTYPTVAERLAEINSRLARIEELIDRFLPYVERMLKNPFLRIGKH